ncbi:MAG: TonB-dependent receptor [bacterium]
MNMNRNKLFTVVKSTLAISLASCLASNAALAADDEDAAELDPVAVTGSNIKRSDVEGALPVTVITREQIQMSGESSAADYLRNLTFNSSGSFRPQSGSSAQGTSSLSLRGIGSNRTLVLIDGHRLPKSPSTGSNQDLNVIPLGAIERIEVLTDGASSIYGSDAMGGVVNIITRSDFQGAEIMLGAGNVSLPEDGGDREEGSIVFGAASDTSSLIGGVSWNHRDIIFARDFYFNQGGASVFGNSFTTITDGFDNFDWRSIPDGNGGTACDFPGTAFFTLGQRCAYDYTQVSADEASSGNKSIWVKGKHDINDDWQVWSTASISKSNSFGRYAPVPDSSYFSVPLSPNSPNNPTNPNGNVYDPTLGLDPQTVNWWHRFDALGNRDSFVDNELVDLQVGTNGTIGEVLVEAGLRRTTNRTNEIGRNYLLRSAAAAAIESGAYDLRNPYATPDDVLNGMKVTTSRIGQYDQNEYWASAQFDIMELSAGPVTGFIGASYLEEIYSDQYDSLSEAGQVGGSAGNSAGGDRDAKAVYFETIIPLMENLEMNFAGRYDKYSDYGSDFSPKVSLRWQPMDNLTVRGSYGQGFRAPTLDILTQKDSESADSVRDPQSCINQGQPANCSLQINGTRTANPSLSSETSDQFAFGVAYEPLDWMNLTVDYFNIKIDNRIKFFGAQTLVNAEQAGDPIPAGLGVFRTPNGSIRSIIQGYGNEGNLKTSGVDINVRMNFEVLGGRTFHNLQWSHLLTQSLDGGRDLVKDPGTPADRVVLANTYEYGDFSFGYNLNMIGKQFDDIVDGEGVGHVPTWVTHDIQGNYHTPWDGKITLGIRNVGEKKPPVGLGFVDSRDYDFNLYDAYGRISYVRYTQSF